MFISYLIINKSFEVLCQLNEINQDNQYIHAEFDDLRSTIEESAQKFLHMAGVKPIDVPIEIDVILIGFDGTGAYQYECDVFQLEKMLSKAYEFRRPVNRNTGEYLLSQYMIKYRVIHASSSSGQDKTNINLIESVIEENLRYKKLDPGKIYEPAFSSDASDVKVYAVEATKLEDTIDQIVEGVFNSGKEKVRTLTPNWYHKNAIVIINPSKRRMIKSHSETENISKPFNIKEWDKGIFDVTKIFAEEANYVYYYQYNNAGKCTSWISSKSYVIIDISAGPVKFGPGISPSGSVSPYSVPRLINMLYSGASSISIHRPNLKDTELFSNLAKVRDTMMRGKMGSTIVSAIQHLFLPDVWVDNALDMKRVIVPMMVIRNHNDFNPLEAGTKYSINTTLVYNEMVKIVGGRDKIVLTQSLHSLHKHKQLATAVYKALYTKSEIYTSHGMGGSSGSTTNLRSYIDGEILLDEFEHAEDILISGTLGDLEYDNINSKHKYLHKARNRFTSRVMPVFVLSLKDIPFNLAFENQDLYVADNRAVIVLQTVSKLHNSEIEARYTGHYYGHTPVVSTTVRVDRNIIAGLATSITGLTPPYEIYDMMKDEPVLNNWMWSTGNTPFGPYSECTSISLLTVETVQRNAFMAKLEKLLFSMKNLLNEVENFSAMYIKQPFEALYVERQKTTIETSKIDLMYKKASGDITPPLPETVVEELENKLQYMEKQIVSICSDLYASKFREVESATRLLNTKIRQYETKIMIDLRNAKRKLECCKVVYGRSTNVDDANTINTKHAIFYVMFAIFLMIGICLFVFFYGYFKKPQEEDGLILTMSNR